MSFLKISACSANYGHADLFQVIDRLGALNYDAVEITAMYHARPAEMPPQRRKEILKRARDAGMSISGLHFIFPPGLKMASSDKAERRKVVDYVNTVTNLAHDLEAPIVMIGGGGMRAESEGVDKETAIENVCDTFRGIGDHAETRGVIACYEALNRFETQIGRSFAEVSGYLDRIGSPSVKLGGDTFHMNIEEPSIERSIEAAGERLAHLHLPDSHRLAPGDGHIDFAPVLRALRRIDYKGYVSFEMFWIAPDIAYLPTYELCDAENVKAIKYIRELEATL